MALEYLKLCEAYADLVHIEAIKQHVKAFFAWDTRWYVRMVFSAERVLTCTSVRTGDYTPFLELLAAAESLDAIVTVCSTSESIARWRQLASQG